MKLLSNLLTLASSLITLILVIMIAVTNFLVKIHAAQFNQTVLYVLTLVVFIIEVTIQTILYIYFGVRVLRTIKKRSLKLKQESNRNAFVNSIQKPLTKTFVLLISMGISTVLQVLAAIASVLASSFSSDSNVVSYFLNSFGILLFAGCVVLMYNPLLSDEYNNIDLYEAKERERQLLLNETSSMGSELSSPRQSFFTNSPRNHRRTSQQFPYEHSNAISRIVSDSSMTSSATITPTTSSVNLPQQEESATTMNDQSAIEENRKSIVVSLVNLKDLVTSPPEEVQTLPSVTSPSTTIESCENQQF
ncbi:predicted protein [Naegleria gruberi]|uniref:Predicted protein n=1 Tax=Naegleria gruberi TaxID=5762 RepID=D2VAW6_NAEGR|nr:uncharacterized protein NAEGRDRAFT_48060 [Naegleria gruberi]EFC46020.1 predicted protein [Naegleria gruberi]|eukprot:XP_002678764.1 predicted protein [Naegleria gruberi strain NEG-M]